MITLKKLSIYRKYGGDIDMWVRINRNNKSNVMDDDDWSLIENLVNDIRLVQNDLASEEYGNNLQKKLSEACENEETINQLKGIAAR